MARRKRLTPPRADYLEGDEPIKGPLSMPPIAQVAGEAASDAALQTLSDEMARARAEGRFIEALSLDAIDATYLVRDRIGVAEEDQEALVASLRDRGQQTPIEVVDLGQGRYGLIAGWRRLMALRSLHSDTGEDRFALVEARITRPGETADAYCAMVEENEIRVGLSHYERARIAVKAVEEGVFPHDRAALDTLYASASRAKKSKVGSFIALVRHLDGTLRHPSAIGERLGLSLSKRLSEDRGFAPQLTRALKAANPRDAQAEQLVLQASLIPPLETKSSKPPSPGVTATWSKAKQEIRLAGAEIDADLFRDLQAWLKSRG